MIRLLPPPTTITRNASRPTTITRNASRPTTITRNASRPTTITKNVSRPTTITRNASRSTTIATYTRPTTTTTIRTLLPLLVALVAAETVQVTAANDQITWYNIGKFLQEFANVGLGAGELQKHLNQDYMWDNQEVRGHEKLHEITQRVTKLFEQSIRAVEDLQLVVEQEYETWPSLPRGQINESVLCCKAEEPSSTGCSLLATHGQQDELILATQTPASVLFEMNRIQNLYKNRITQYFAFNDGSLFVFPARRKNYLPACDSYDPRLRYYFTQAKSPEPRDVVVVVDAEQRPNPLLQKLVQRTFNALSPLDRVALCLPEDDTCSRGSLSPGVAGGWPEVDQPLRRQKLLGTVIVGSRRNKERLNDLLNAWLKSRPPTVLPSSDGVVPSTVLPSGNTSRNTSPSSAISSGFSSHIAALTAGTEVLLNSFKQPFNLPAESPHFVMVYVTDRSGWQHWEEDEELMAALNGTLDQSISIVVNPIKDAGEGVKDTELLHLNKSTLKLVAFPTLEKFYASQTSVSSFGVTVTERPVIPMPYWDAFGDGYIMSVCLPLSARGEFVGATCIDYSIINLLADVSIDDINNAYVFIVNSQGNTVVHPLLPSPHALTMDPAYVTIDKLERDPNVRSFLRDIVRQKPGFKDVIKGTRVVSVGRPRGRLNLPNAVQRQRASLRYLWGPINGTDLSIALVLPLKSGKVMASKYHCYNSTDCHMKDFHYHLPKPSNTRSFCRFFGTRAIADKGLVKFAPDCFNDLLGYIRGETNQEIALLYSIFHGDSPYDELLSKDLRASVKLVEKAERVWKRAANLSNYIGQQYMGTADGTLIAFPGTVLKQTYDHRTRPWYLLAISTNEEDAVSMTTPYCDELGAGMMYTITKALQGPLGNPMAVVAGDFTLQYIQAIFLKNVPYCSQHTCLLVDRLGYIVIKLDQVPHSTSPRDCHNDTDLISAHITSIAPDIARDLISSKVLRRHGCHDYEREVTFYFWSMELNGYKTQHKGKYYLMYKIPASNLFLVVRTERLMGYDSCHCDHFLNEETMECRNTCDLACECPCVAGLNTRPCHDLASDLHRWPLPACKPRGLTLTTAKNYTSKQLSALPPCNNAKCDVFEDETNCNEVVFCLWLGNKCIHVDSR
ncbi:VWFA and cache domain-containing protein 1-like isoform X2 [Homarus americanus]|uniref:VWFA and cache domain-containing protein 1-like isoform X2 n=1 Tax=Homarus americanus TaxID=6706 RepID=UPI001C44B54C|nr:VWFA and cache domain-containing protein 1-like isoform X2 [Homarus americanus]